MSNGTDLPPGGVERRAGKPVDERVKDTVRALLALMFGSAVVWGFLFGRVGNLTLVSADAFSTIAIAVILWWFKDQSDEKRANETATAAAVVAKAALGDPPKPPPIP